MNPLTKIVSFEIGCWYEYVGMLVSVKGILNSLANQKEINVIQKEKNRK
jgi:hypothetical protein